MKTNSWAALQSYSAHIYRDHPRTHAERTNDSFSKKKKKKTLNQWQAASFKFSHISVWVYWSLYVYNNNKKKKTRVPFLNLISSKSMLERSVWEQTRKISFKSPKCAEWLSQAFALKPSRFFFPHTIWSANALQQFSTRGVEEGNDNTSYRCARNVQLPHLATRCQSSSLNISNGCLESVLGGEVGVKGQGFRCDS